MEENYTKIHPSAKKLWVINGVIASIIIMSVCYVIGKFTSYLVLIPGVAISIYITVVHPFFEYRQWAYRISEKHIDFIHGIVFRKRTLIPVSRIQHMDIKQGPLQKKFSLANIAIFTAGQSHEIEAVLYSEAQEIVSSINKRIMKDEEDGKL
ncbi:MAG: PH domain-containing protein [Clostridia bacterium]|nr:PH domain-containing protein [Clostridia bacterium]